MALERFDPSSPQHRDDPYTLYKKYREAEPVHWGLAPDPNTSGSWYFFEYEDVLAALKSDKFIHNRSTGSSSQAGTASVPPAFIVRAAFQFACIVCQPGLTPIL